MCALKFEKTQSRKDTVFDGGLFNPLQLWLHLFGVLTEVNTLKTDGGETVTTTFKVQKTWRKHVCYWLIVNTVLILLNEAKSWFGQPW